MSDELRDMVVLEVDGKFIYLLDSSNPKYDKEALKDLKLKVHIVQVTSEEIEELSNDYLKLNERFKALIKE